MQGVFGFDTEQATVASGGTFVSLLDHCYEALETMFSITGSLYKVNNIINHGLVIWRVCRIHLHMEFTGVSAHL